MKLDLDDQQVALLREVLDGAARDLSYEIANTDSGRYKDELKARRELLSALLADVGGSLPDDG